MQFVHIIEKFQDGAWVLTDVAGSKEVALKVVEETQAETTHECWEQVDQHEWLGKYSGLRICQKSVRME